MKALCALAIAGLAALPSCTEAGKKVAAAEDAVRKLLKDPGSAVFSDVVLGRYGSGVEGVCGWVNARNAFGAMAGPKLFAVSLPDDGGAVVDAIDRDRGGTARMMCNNLRPAR